MLLTIEEAKTVMAGRNPIFFNFLNDNYGDEDWNDFVSDYNTLEGQIDDTVKTGIIAAPIRPRPETR